jgi:4-amino-4-deoxy-L-arabinose transferase-like glycosyltransferase
VTARKAAALVVGFSLLRGALFALLVPPLHGVDEPAHFDYVQRLAESGALPLRERDCAQLSLEVRAATNALVVPTQYRPERPYRSELRLSLPGRDGRAHDDGGRDRSARETTGCGPAASYPPLYYATAALAYRGVHSSPLLQRLLAARLVSVLWGALAALCACLGGARLFGSARDGLLLGLCVACQPMLGFLFSVVNNDAALFAAAAGALASLAFALREPSRIAPLCALSLSALVGTLTKPTMLVHLPALFALGVSALGLRPLRKFSHSSLRISLALAPAALAGLAWSWATPSLLDRGAPAQPALPLWDYLQRYVFSLERLRFLWLKMYWMAWGWADTWLSPLYYALIAAVLLSALLLALLRFRALPLSTRGLLGSGALATVLSLCALYAIELPYVRRTGDTLLQGRYLLPLFPLHAAMLIAALRSAPKGEPAAPSQPMAPARLDPAWSFLLLLAALDAASAVRALARYHA